MNTRIFHIAHAACRPSSSAAAPHLTNHTYLTSLFIPPPPQQQQQEQQQQRQQRSVRPLVRSYGGSRRRNGNA